MNASLCEPVVVQGTPREIGEQLGQLSRGIFSVFLEQSSTWRDLQPWRGHAILNTIRENITVHFPWIYEEIEGMASVLNMEILDMLLWNCRGDFLHSSQDGCTSVTTFSGGVPTCGHNEDGDPFLLSHCRIIDVRPLTGPRFVSFFYPGSIPGHSFGFNICHMIHTVNNLRIEFNESKEVWKKGIPRMVISRALLTCSSLRNVVEMLRTHRPIGGFHYTLSKMVGGGDIQDTGDNSAVNDECCVLSVEHTSEKLSVVHLNPDYEFTHSNHTVHEEYISHLRLVSRAIDPVLHEVFPFDNGDKSAVHNSGEVVTLSSKTRYERASSIIRNIKHKENNYSFHKIRQVLTDRSDENLNNCPVLRHQPDDPDEENTISSITFTSINAQDANSSGCQLNIYNFNQNTIDKPIFSMTL